MSRPTIHAIAATSSDGFIAPSGKLSEKSTRWTSQKDTEYFKEVTKDAGVVILGRKTFETFGSKPLPKRLNIVYTTDPDLLKMPWTEKIGFTNQDPATLFKRPELQGFENIFICGGQQIYDMFLPHVQNLHLTVEKNVVFGEGIQLSRRGEAWKKRIEMETFPYEDETTSITMYLLRRVEDIPRDKTYPDDAVQCDDCGGSGYRHDQECPTCGNKGWLPAGHPHRRICDNPDCGHALPPDHSGVYCTVQCAVADA